MFKNSVPNNLTPRSFQKREVDEEILIREDKYVNTAVLTLLLTPLIVFVGALCALRPPGSAYRERQ